MKLRKHQKVKVRGGREARLGDWTDGKYVKRVPGRKDLRDPYIVDVSGRLFRFTEDEIQLEGAS